MAVEEGRGAVRCGGHFLLSVVFSAAAAFVPHLCFISGPKFDGLQRKTAEGGRFSLLRFLSCRLDGGNTGEVSKQTFFRCRRPPTHRMSNKQLDRELNNWGRQQQ